MTFEETLTFRHACKIFDENRKISDSDFAKIIEAGRMSPSSMGLEHWELELITDTTLKQNLRKTCWDQAQITTCSHLLVIYARIADFRVGSDYIAQMLSRRFDKDPQMHRIYIEKTADFLRKNVGQSDIEIFAWSKAQCFLAAMNMMSMAATLGIDSCAIEGYVETELNAVLSNEPSKRRVAMLLSLGYRKNPQKAKIRQSVDEILTIR